MVMLLRVLLKKNGWLKLKIKKKEKKRKEEVIFYYFGK